MFGRFFVHRVVARRDCGSRDLERFLEIPPMLKKIIRCGGRASSAGKCPIDRSSLESNEIEPLQLAKSRLGKVPTNESPSSRSITYSSLLLQQESNRAPLPTVARAAHKTFRAPKAHHKIAGRLARKKRRKKNNRTHPFDVLRSFCACEDSHPMVEVCSS